MTVSRFFAVLPLALAGAFCLGCIPDPVPDAPNGSVPPGPVAGLEAAPIKPLVDLTPLAASTALEIIRDGQEGGTLPKETLYFRVRLVAGGCCGFLHKLDLDPDVNSEDQIFEVRGVKVVVFKRQADMLRGTVVDFKDAKERGFSVKNTNFEGEALKKWLPVLQAQEKK